MKIISIKYKIKEENLVTKELTLKSFKDKNSDLTKIKNILNSADFFGVSEIYVNIDKTNNSGKSYAKELLHFLFRELSNLPSEKSFITSIIVVSHEFIRNNDIPYIMVENYDLILDIINDLINVAQDSNLMVESIIISNATSDKLNNFFSILQQYISSNRERPLENIIMGLTIIQSDINVSMIEEQSALNHFLKLHFYKCSYDDSDEYSFLQKLCYKILRGESRCKDLGFNKKNRNYFSEAVYADIKKLITEGKLMGLYLNKCLNEQQANDLINELYKCDIINNISKLKKLGIIFGSRAKINLTLNSQKKLAKMLVQGVLIDVYCRLDPNLCLDDGIFRKALDTENARSKGATITVDGHLPEDPEELKNIKELESCNKNICLFQGMHPNSFVGLITQKAIKSAESHTDFFYRLNY